MYVETVPNRNSKPTILLREDWREGRRRRKREEPLTATEAGFERIATEVA